MAKSPRSSPPSPPRVALFLETSAGSGRDMLRGIARYVRESGPWALHHEPRTAQFVEGWAPKWLSDWKGEGILGRFRSNSIVKAVKRAKVPVVDMLGASPNPPFPLVEPDNAAVARLAAEHLIGRGFHQFGYIGPSDVPWSQDRFTAFRKMLNDRGYPCDGASVGVREPARIVGRIHRANGTLDS